MVELTMVEVSDYASNVGESTIVELTTVSDDGGGWGHQGITILVMPFTPTIINLVMVDVD